MHLILSYRQHIKYFQWLTFWRPSLVLIPFHLITGVCLMNILWSRSERIEGPNQEGRIYLNVRARQNINPDTQKDLQNI